MKAPPTLAEIYQQTCSGFMQEEDSRFVAELLMHPSLENMPTTYTAAWIVYKHMQEEGLNEAYKARFKELFFKGWFGSLFGIGANTFQPKSKSFTKIIAIYAELDAHFIGLQNELAADPFLMFRFIVSEKYDVLCAVDRPTREEMMQKAVNHFNWLSSFTKVKIKKMDFDALYFKNN